MTTKQQFLVTIESTRPIESITDFIGQRLWSLEHKGARVLDVTASLLREDMTVMITADIPGASIDSVAQIQQSLSGVTLNMQQIAEQAVSTFDPRLNYADGGLVDPKAPAYTTSGFLQLDDRVKQNQVVERPRYQEDPLHAAMDDMLDAATGVN